MPDTQALPEETLRKAAALMRERAETATPGPWEDFAFADGSLFVERVSTNDDDAGDEIAVLARSSNATHVASWHPAVALVVADWLDATAAEHESDSGNATVDAFFAAIETAPDRAAVAVARAYLGESV